MKADPAILIQEYADRLWNQHDLSAIDAYSHPAGVVHESPHTSRTFSIDEIRSRVERILTLMPDHSMMIGEIFTETTSAIWSWRISGTWRLPNGEERPIDLCGSSVYWFSGNKIVRRSGEADALRFDYQLGRVKRDIRIQFPM